ncbi:MAG: S-methyl-5-thioribose-1-phosphate isomerase [Gemmatimonadota bacterium]
MSEASDTRAASASDGFSSSSSSSSSVSGSDIPRPVRWSSDGRAVELLDQTLLPGEERYLRLESAEEVAEAIASLRVRGAPAIGIAGAMGLALGMERALRKRSGREGADHPPLEDFLDSRLEDLRETLRRTRPTGRNLEWALDRLVRAFRRSADEGPEAAVAALRAEADGIRAEDEEMCRRIGEAGLAVFPQEEGRDAVGVLTHCNAGALATGGMGTALAPLYLARERGWDLEVFASETRPVLQGARLTAWELGRAGVRSTVVTDLATGALMKSGRIRLVVVGADRIAANGDVANKIGTYALAVLARHHGIPFYVAAPRSTFDPELASGHEIAIEERDPSEVRGLAGRETAPRDAGVWNPAFDVTPSHMVTAFLTDGGVLRPPYEITIADLLAAVGGVGPPGTRLPTGAENAERADGAEAASEGEVDQENP